MGYFTFYTVAVHHNSPEQSSRVKEFYSVIITKLATKTINPDEAFTEVTDQVSVSFKQEEQLSSAFHYKENESKAL